jgi:gluconate 2-dehydrogenase gamma chain
MHEKPSRREFLTSSASIASVGWLTLNASALAALSACAREAAQQNAPFTTLTADEGRTLSAFAAQILPSGDGLPGAEELGCVHFMDHALGSYFAGQRELFADGVKDLDARARTASPPAASFAELTSAQQIEIMKTIEAEPFFGAARSATLMGAFADPSHGGNRDGAGFRMLKIEHHPTHTPPFGFYDAETVA